jgi:hypothetical protein
MNNGVVNNSNVNTSVPNTNTNGVGATNPTVTNVGGSLQPVITQTQQVATTVTTPAVSTVNVTAQPTAVQTTSQPTQQLISTVSQPQPNVVVPPTGTIPPGGVVLPNVTDGPIDNRKKKNYVPLLIFVIFLLIVYIVYSTKSHQTQVENLTYNCTPITASEEETELDVNSTLVKDLYSKVSTSIREDIAQPEFNDNMKLYLAYRQILETDKYDSNCNLFDSQKMEPFTCEVSLNFVPQAFKVETLEQEIKKLYGENTVLNLTNIQLGSSCIGGYQYIPERGEFVQGYCSQQNATSFKVTKTLKSATSTRTTIVLKEEVKYHENEKMNLPSYLKSGTYYYTFRLDLNYNYVFVSKTYEEKY